MGGTQTPKHILRTTGGEEDPGVSHRESHLLALGVARTQPSAACWQQPRGYDLAGMVRGAPQAQSRTEPGSGTDERDRWERGGNNNRKRFWDRSGRLFFFFFVPLFSDVETTQCEEEDRSRQDTETERQAGVLSSTRSEREVKTENESRLTKNKQIQLYVKTTEKWKVSFCFASLNFMGSLFLFLWGLTSDGGCRSHAEGIRR